MKRRRGFSLVEVIFALAVASFCLLLVFSLLPLGIGTNHESLEETTAASLSGQIVADLRGSLVAADPTDNSTPVSTPVYSINIPAPGSSAQSTSLFLSPSGAVTSTSGNATPGPIFRATVTVNPPATASRSATTARVWITWPGQADSNPTATPSHYSGSFVTVVGLNRN